MSANDILDVLNVQRDDQPVKKKPRHDSHAAAQPPLQKGGMARELYNLLGPNTPPVNLNAKGSGQRLKKHQRVSPWTRMKFVPQRSKGTSPALYHWEKGSRELLESEDKDYYFDRFQVSVDIPEMVDEATYDNIMNEIREQKEQMAEEKRRRREEKRKAEEKAQTEVKQEKDAKQKVSDKEEKVADEKAKGDVKSGSEKSKKNDDAEKGDEKNSKVEKSEDTEPKTETTDEKANKSEKEPEAEWTYEETKLLFQFCRDFELKWHVINDRYPSGLGRSLEDLKEQFYRVCAKILKYNGTGNPNLLDSLDAFSKHAEVDRKQYLESLLKRTPAEIAEEESLVIEARRFELAAKKMLLERSQLLALLDSPQSTQSVQQYQSSQGLTNLYNNLMILDKHQKKKLSQKAAQANTDPVPPPIPQAASSSHKRDRGFQTHLQQYLSGVLKQQNGERKKSEPSAIQQLLSKRLTSKEEEAYGLYYHANERLNPSVILRSTQKLSGLQQRQSVFKAVNSMLQDLDIPTAGGTVWRPNMPTRKTMAKYDEMIKSVVALLDVKKAKDKLEAEIELVKSQRDM